jgi:hypothetical protein
MYSTDVLLLSDRKEDAYVLTRLTCDIVIYCTCGRTVFRNVQPKKKKKRILVQFARIEVRLRGREGRFLPVLRIGSLRFLEPARPFERTCFCTEQQAEYVGQKWTSTIRYRSACARLSDSVNGVQKSLDSR